MSELIDSIKSKPSLDEYRRIFTRLNANKSEQQLKKHFESCRDLAASQLEKHPFWIDLAKQIPDWDALYRKNTSAVGLYSGPFSAQALLNKKEWESLFSKIYRKNVINCPKSDKSHMFNPILCSHLFHSKRSIFPNE